MPPGHRAPHALAALLLIASASPARAGTVYVVRGGTVAASRATVQEAVSRDARPGDLLLLAPGTYFECVRVARDGTAAAPITIAGAGPGAAILDAAYEPWTRAGNGRWTALGRGVYRADASGLAFGRGRRMPSAALRGGQRLWTYASRAAFDRFAAGSGVFYDATARHLYLRFDDGRDPNGVPLSISRCDHALAFGVAQHWVARDLVVQNGGYATIAVGLNGEWAANITLEELLVRNGMNGVMVAKARSAGNTVRRNLVTTAFDPGWYWSDFYAEPSDLTGAGIVLVDSGAGNAIHDNEVTGYFDGIATATSTGPAANAGALIYRNTIHHTLDDAIELESGDAGTMVFFNTIYDAYVAISAAPVTAGPVYIFRNLLVANRIIRANRARGSTDTPLVFKIGAAGTATRGLRIYHNTAFSLGRVVDGNWGGPLLPAASVFANNIFYSSGGVLVANSGLAAAGNVYEGNLYYRPDGLEIVKQWNCSPEPCGWFKSLAAARGSSAGRAAGWEAAGIQADPLFRSTGGVLPDLRLLPGSPAIDGAVTLPAAWPDIVVPMGSAADLGAIESGSPAADDGGWPPALGAGSPPPAPLPDAEVRSFTATTSGGMVTFALEICNAGATAATFVARIHLDATAAPACGDPGDGDATVTLAPGACLSASVPVGGLPPGRYTGLLALDADCALRESDESNNAASDVYTVISP